ncbi:hypothetical protein GCM10010299_60300 [Streptomyces tanashiensis]|nr:hypothetical protein GCM10010299_60300 [Streptomyces tanashiensis]
MADPGRWARWAKDSLNHGREGVNSLTRDAEKRFTSGSFRTVGANWPPDGADGGTVASAWRSSLPVRPPGHGVGCHGGRVRSVREPGVGPLGRGTRRRSAVVGTVVRASGPRSFAVGGGVEGDIRTGGRPDGGCRR